MSSRIDPKQPPVLRDGPDTISTHVSTLVFLGDFVYKFRKPVQYGFLDLSNPESRRRDCEREVALNRRIAPDVYLGVAEVMLPGLPLEPVVVMRRLPADLSLVALASEDRDLSTELRSLARVLVDFHGSARRSPEFDEDATAGAIGTRWAQNFTECAPYVGSVFDPRCEFAIQRLVERYLDGRVPLFERRITLGRICDGHGDLQAADIFCLPDGPRVLDCLEFDDRLRHVDVIDDLSFLLMDLDRLGARAAASELLCAYEELSGDVVPASLIDHYRAYHAYVRAKVACLRSGHDATAADEARKLQALALSYLERACVRLVLVGGLPGTGKSTLATALAERTGAILFRSDEIRKELALKRVNEPMPAAYECGPYAPEMTAATYEELLNRAGIALRHGSSVVLDASWNASAFRLDARNLAEDVLADLSELHCVLDLSSAAERIATRQRRGDRTSDATVEIAASMASATDPWPSAAIIDTSSTRKRSLALAMRVLTRDPPDLSQRRDFRP